MGVVTRRYLPSEESMIAALAVRVDVLDGQTTKIRADLAALTRGVGDLTGQIRHATALTGPIGPTRPGDTRGDTGGDNRGDNGGGTEPDSRSDRQDADEEEAHGQPDWFAVDDVDTAQAWLTGLTGWVEAVLTHHGVSLPVACWPLHPAVVVDLLALSQERAGAYGGDTPTPVSEWLSRWLPAAADRISAALTGCAADRGHRHDGRVYDVADFDPFSAAAWWVLDRTTPAPAAFALTPLT